MDPEGARTRRLTLELDLGAEPVSGTLAGAGFRWRFEGWLSLASALERARHEDGRALTESTSPTP